MAIFQKNLSNLVLTGFWGSSNSLTKTFFHLDFSLNNKSKFDEYWINLHFWRKKRQTPSEENKFLEKLFFQTTSWTMFKYSIISIKRKYKVFFGEVFQIFPFHAFSFFISFEFMLRMSVWEKMTDETLFYHYFRLSVLKEKRK